MDSKSAISGIDRFDIPPYARIPGIALVTGFVGLVKGARNGYQRAADRYLVENSHRLPTTKGGWYFYHKRKNWVCMKAAVNQGLKGSVKLSVLLTGFFSFEALLDYTRNQVDFLNTLTTTVLFGLVYSRWYDLNGYASRQVLKKGVVLGLLGGLTQDVLRKLRNGDVWYLRKIDVSGLQAV